VNLTPVSRPPESNPSFRRGQLLVLLSTFTVPLTVDRIGYFEFFAANPHLVVTKGDTAVRLELAGFNPSALSYQSAPERFANRRARLRTDLAALTAWGYVQPGVEDGRIVCSLTTRGRQEASGLSSLYADAYRASIDLIRPLFRLSDTALARSASSWLAGGRLRVDVLDVESNTELSLEFGVDTNHAEGT
jgi:hypothetical protein